KLRQVEAIRLAFTGCATPRPARFARRYLGLTPRLPVAARLTSSPRWCVGSVPSAASRTRRHSEPTISKALWSANCPRWASSAEDGTPRPDKSPVGRRARDPRADLSAFTLASDDLGVELDAVR